MSPFKLLLTNRLTWSSHCRRLKPLCEPWSARCQWPEPHPATDLDHAMQTSPSGECCCGWGLRKYNEARYSCCQPCWGKKRKRERESLYEKELYLTTTPWSMSLASQSIEVQKCLKSLLYILTLHQLVSVSKLMHQHDPCNSTHF